MSTPSLGLIVPADLLDLLRSVAPDGRVGRLRPTIGGFSNLTFEAELADGTVVVKAARNDDKRIDVAHEARMLRALEDVSLPVPRLRATVSDDQWTVNITDRLEGDPGTSMLQTHAADLPGAAALLARVLQAVHAAAPAPVSDRFADLTLRLRSVADRLEVAVAADASLAAVAPSLLEAIAHPAVARGAALVHGDIGFHNTLWSTTDDGRLALRGLIDWEWSGWGNPLLDLSWLWWTLRFRRLSPAVWDAFVSAYGDWAIRAVGWDDTTVLDLVRAQMAAILVRTEPGAPARGEWISRITALDAMSVPPV